jgi:hypothetical protein
MLEHLSELVLGGWHIMVMFFERVFFLNTGKCVSERGRHSGSARE